MKSDSGDNDFVSDATAMEAWSNIQVFPHDPEIAEINKLEANLGTLPDKIYKIRGLITGFEICHFKYKRHLQHIKDSIHTLEPLIDAGKIGINHIRYGEKVLNNDTSGRSLAGLQYVWTIQDWLSNNSKNKAHDNYDKKLSQQIHEWLGEKSPAKVRLVRLLLARLTWDWKSYEEYQSAGRFKDIELQACRTDICHYAFPGNLNRVIQAIGQMKAADETGFEGCGSYNDEIKESLEKEFSELNDMLHYFREKMDKNKDDLIKVWLIACLAKTIKENLHITHQFWK